MGSDWNFGGSSGGSNWSFGPSGGSKKPKKASSSDPLGGLLGEIGGEIKSHTPNIIRSGLSDAAQITGNAAGQVGSIIHGIPGAAANIGEATWHDLSGGKTHDPRLSSWSFLFEHPIAYGEAYLHDPTTFGGRVVEPQVQVTGQDIRALRRGDWHYFQKNPLNPVLDALTVASVGGAGALRLARTGALGERAAEVANTERLLKVGDHAEALNQARTLQGRIRQRLFDQWSMNHPDTKIAGANVRMAKILNKRATSGMLRARLPIRQFQKIAAPLTPAEIFAYHVAAEGVPLDERIAYYRARVVEHLASGGKPKAVRPIENYLQSLESPAVRDVLENPRPQFIQALQAGKGLEAKAGERLVQTGQLSAETRASRAGRVQEEMLGSTQLETNPVNPAFPAPFRFAHITTKGQSPARLFIPPKTEGMLGKATPLKQLKHNASILLRNAVFHTDPTRVLTSDYLQTMRHELVVQMQKESLDPISRELTATEVATGFKKPEEWYYRPSYDRKTTAPVPREVQQAEALTQDRAIMDTTLAREGAQKASGGVVAKDLRSLGVDARDEHNLAKLQELGIRRVPAAFGKNFQQEFAGTSAAVRLFYDRPLDVWRAITLNFRPAWMVNNFVGNAIMGLATYGPAGAASYLRVLLAHERGPDKVRQLWKFTMKHPTLRRKYADVFAEVAPDLHSAGLYGTQTRVTNPGVYEGRLASLAANPAVKALGFVPTKLGHGLMAVGRGITHVEVLFAEDTSREAAFIREAGGDIAKIRETARKMGEGNLALSEALKRMDRQSVELAVQRVNDALGDFNDLSRVERSVVRRVIPFYSWFKVITKVSAKYAARYPARLLLLKNIEQAQSKKGDLPLPAWLRGSLQIGKTEHGVATLLTTQGLNPYETINQLATGGAGSVLSPFATAGVVGLTGRDPTFGGLQDYYGLGANKRGGWSGQAEMGLGSLLSGLAPARLYSQSANYQGKLYAPHTYGHAGPVPINDFLLQYLGLPIRHVKVKQAKKERGLQ